MPYLQCPNCGLTTYSPPTHTGSMSCPNCCAQLSDDARLFHDYEAAEPGIVKRRLSPDVTAPARARRAAGELRSAVPNGRFDDVELMISELVTNAVRHGHHGGGRSVLLVISVQPSRVRVSVSDDGDGFAPPAPEPSGDEDPHGRGLLIVDRLSDRWGVETETPTTVWFEVDLDGRAADP